MTRPHKGFARLAPFKSMPFEDADERFGFSETDDVPPAGFNIAVEDVFGDEPEEVFVHKGHVKHRGDLAIGAVGDYAGVYVIDGDLEVGGLLEFTQIDGGAVLLVTGSLKATSLAVAQEAQLWVGKGLEVRDYVLAGVSDAGGIAVKGATSAMAIIVTDSEMISFGKKPKARVIERHEGLLDGEEFKKVEEVETALLAPFNSEDVDYEQLVTALRQGQRLLVGK